MLVDTDVHKSSRVVLIVDLVINKSIIDAKDIDM